jgi:NADPH:quinone reductase-like Zn-dependent oxidoreductase
VVPGCSSYAIALAKRRGLTVIAEAKPDDEALVRSFGADEVVPRDGGLDSGIEADGLFDTALLGPAAFPAVRDGGRMVVVCGWRHGPAGPTGSWTRAACAAARSSCSEIVRGGRARRSSP